MIAMRTSVIFVFLLAIAVGCDSIVGTASTTSAEPSNEQVQFCRDALFIDPSIEIGAIGFFKRPDFRFDAIAFKFTAEAQDAQQIFLHEGLASDKMLAETFGMLPKVAVGEKWWNPESAELFSDTITTVVSGDTKTQEFCVATSQGDDGELIVYVYARIGQ